MRSTSIPRTSFSLLSRLAILKCWTTLTITSATSCTSANSHKHVMACDIPVGNLSPGENNKFFYFYIFCWMSDISKRVTVARSDLTLICSRNRVLLHLILHCMWKMEIISLTLWMSVHVLITNFLLLTSANGRETLWPTRQERPTAGIYNNFLYVHGMVGWHLFFFSPAPVQKSWSIVR